MLYKISYFPATFIHSKSKIKVELDLSIYIPKSGLKLATGIDTSEFAQKADLMGFKLDVDQLDFDKFETAHVDLSKLSNVTKKILLTRVYLMNWLKKLMLFTQTNDNLEKRLKMLIKIHLILVNLL